MEGRSSSTSKASWNGLPPGWIAAIWRLPSPLRRRRWKCAAMDNVKDHAVEQYRDKISALLSAFTASCMSEAA